MKTWKELNSGYQHNLLTDELIVRYVRDHFHAKNPDIEETFLQAKDFVLQLDLIKYMVLWAEGGVYSDLDVACVQSIGQWVPSRFMDKAGIVLGVQREQNAGNAEDSFELVDWTIMSKPNQPFLWFLYQRFTENIKRLAAGQVGTMTDSRPYNVSDVTGRKALTQAFLAYVTSVTATKVTADNFTEVAEPTMFGEILVLPVQSFASSHRNRRELVHHYEAGSWKSEPWDKLQSAGNEGQKQNEPEGIGTAEPPKPSEEDNKASPADQKKPTSDKPPSVQYENAQVKEKPTTNDKPPSVQYQNIKFAANTTESKHNTTDSTMQNPTNDNTDTKDPTDKDTETKAKEEEAQKLKAQALEQEKEAAEAQKKEEQEQEEKNQIAEAQKRKEDEEKKLADEEAAKRKATEPKWAPLNEAGTLVSSNNLADYGGEFVPSE